MQSDEPTNRNRLLEAVEASSHRRSRASEAGYIPQCGNPGGPQSKRPAAPLPDTGDPKRYDQPMASVCQRAVGANPLPGYGKVRFVNRPVPTRMRGGGEAEGEKPPANRLGHSVMFPASLPEET